MLIRRSVFAVSYNFSLRMRESFGYIVSIATGIMESQETKMAKAKALKWRKSNF